MADQVIDIAEMAAALRAEKESLAEKTRKFQAAKEDALPAYRERIKQKIESDGFTVAEVFPSQVPAGVSDVIGEGGKKEGTKSPKPQSPPAVQLFANPKNKGETWSGAKHGTLPLWVIREVEEQGRIAKGDDEKGIKRDSKFIFGEFQDSLLKLNEKTGEYEPQIAGLDNAKAAAASVNDDTDESPENQEQETA